MRTRIVGLRGHGSLDIHGAFQRPACAAECQHESITLALYLEAAVFMDLMSDERLVLAQNLEPALVADAQGQSP
jgi:hypothetical protein